MEPHPKPEKLTVELPPGWHGAMQALAEKTGVSLKYLYTLAVDRLLADPDAHGVEEAAWEIERRMRKNLRSLGARHTADEIARRYSDIEEQEKSARKPPRRKD